MGLVDYHVHTARCGHAVGKVGEYLRQAERMGLKELGFADHLPLYFLPPEKRDPGLAMPQTQLGEYVAEITGLKGKSTVEVKLGIEADYVPGREEELRRLLSAYPFDYVLGSIHFLDGWGFDNPAEIEGYRGKDLDLLYERYFSLVQRLASSRLFDIVAHPDLIKKFGFLPSRNLKLLYEETVKAIAAADLAVEVNTAGLRHPVKEIYPAVEFLSLCRRYRVPVTLGSDAHRPEDVGRDFDRALDLLRGVGYYEVAIFTSRKRHSYRVLI
ncbi:histidinol phosphate phosphatase HisJ family [Ammonifex degensii KC4]|uniref:Histidinol-phosphatase n=1 Tax=Ammonifex degensii (strain DSM 10501 / KC4) TaxID=429009 RepID=C9RAU8_AMMDK|nr:histidinol-phosphatase [Ammonifex degensii]ACX51375.1 histidinol phosphate phosphatase HisJ family [Ammonifex degensii KC4]